MPHPKHKAAVASACFALLVLGGCASAYYSVWETLGYEKRDLLRSNVEKAREEQEEAAEQFQTALERLKEVYGFDGGDLEKLYRRLEKEYDASVERADAVRDRVDKVEEIAGDLFAEWERELGEIHNPTLRADSRKKLQATRMRFREMHGAMARAESSMAPVLTQFKDHVLYLKHNLNAQAVGSLRGEVTGIETDVQRLLGDMRSSIAEARAFIEDLPE